MRPAPKNSKASPIASALVLVTAGLGATYVSAARRYEPRALPGTTLPGQPLGGLTQTQVAGVVRAWSLTRLKTPLEFEPAKELPRLTRQSPEELGVKLDQAQIASGVRYDDFLSGLLRRVTGSGPTGGALPVRVGFGKAEAERFALEVDAQVPAPRPARATWSGTAVSRSYEATRARVDSAKLAEEVSRAVSQGTKVKLPILWAKKRVPDSELDRVVTVVGRYATTFSSGPSRTNNIRVAARMIDGHVVMPGEKFSFNRFLGERTESKGFKRAGVYLRGRRDFDTGGGVCQVSTTLYNAVLQAGLDVVSRQPHSMPVHYVPLGQDAAVSYPGLDFAFKNDRAEPVAIATNYRDGRIEFLLLGARKRSGKVTITHKLLRSWGTKTVTEYNPSLRPGTRKLKQNGIQGREVASWRVVTDGATVRRESLGVSTYTGGPTVYEVGPKASAPSAPVAAASLQPQQ